MCGLISWRDSNKRTMDKRKVDHYRKQLLAKQEEIRRMVARSEQDGREADIEITQDLADRAANSYTKEFLFHQSDDNRRILQLIQDALRRADDGSYGFCVECQQDVQTKRLEAVPWARHCIECQEKQEKGLL
jgi:DnaK suppressor protein